MPKKWPVPPCTILAFARGNVATTMEVDGPPNDLVPPDVAIELGQKKATVIGDCKPASSSGRTLRVQSCFLRQLDPRGEPEFVVDMGQVGLNGTRRDEQARGDVLVAEALAHQLDNV